MILFVANTAIQVDDGRHYLPRPDFEFIKSLAEKEIAVSVMNFTTKKDNPAYDYSLNDITGVKILNLGSHKGKGRLTGLNILLTYLKGVIRALIGLFSNNSFMYIYYSGPIPMVTAPFNYNSLYF